MLVSRADRPGPAAWRILLVLVLLSPASASLFAPGAAAVSPQNPALCFDHDSTDTVPGGLVCADEEANYLEGQHVVIIPNPSGTPDGTFVRVKCADGCHELAGRGYYAVYHQKPLRFPDDFHGDAPSGAVDGGNNAIADQAPRYNGTWTVDVFDGASQQAAVTRQFHVWLSTIYRAENMTVMPGGSLQFQVGGVNGDVSLSVQRRGASGGYSQVWSSTRAATDGRLFDTWTIPKSEASGIRECGLHADVCYRIVVFGGGRDNETIYLPAAIARIRVTDLRGPLTAGGILLPLTQAQTPMNLQRTQNLTFGFSFNYPGVAAPNGAVMSPDDLSVDATGQHALRLAVERLDPPSAASPTGSVALLDEASVLYEPSRFRWEAHWVVPKDFPVTNGTYQLRLEERADRYGNRVPSTQLLNFTVGAAHILPTIVHQIEQMPRTEDDYVGLSIQYLNGTPVYPEDLSAPLAGCFVHGTQLTPLACAGPLVLNSTGEWNETRADYEFHVRYPRTYSFLDAHQFWLMGTTPANQTDAYGNDIIAIPGAAFNVVPGSPHVNLTTTMRGLDTSTLERGQVVGVSAQVSYGDGAPFNRETSYNASESIAGTLVRRGPQGAVQSVEPFNLSLVDDEQGIWFTRLDLTRDDTYAPLGRWTMSFHVVDNAANLTKTAVDDATKQAPNLNDTSFDVTVVPAPIRMLPQAQPPSTIQTGYPVRFRFSLLYPPDSAHPDGQPVPANAVTSSLTAQIYKWDARTRRPVGDPVSSTLGLQPKDDGILVEMLVPDSLFSGSYVFVLRGGDQYGNQIQQDAWSRPFVTYTQPVMRQQLTAPAPSVQRGQSASVVFDAQPGDMGLPGDNTKPQIRLERLADAANDTWITESLDVRVDDDTLADHVGSIVASLTMPLGEYRFELVGRDARYHEIAGTYSTHFNVTPAEVERALFDAPPERVVKGQPFSFTVESQRGDRIVQIVPLRDGRAVTMSMPITQAVADHFTVTWSVPFESQPGNYSLRILGRDLYGNSMEVDMPPVQVDPAGLDGKFLGAPAHTVTRRSAAQVSFGITYPDGAFYLATTPPQVNVIDAAGGFVAPAQVSREGLGYAAKWTPTDTTPLGEYRFEVSGQGSAGNSFPTMRSPSFRVLAGSVTRPPISDAPPSVERLNGFDLVAPTLPGDSEPVLALEYFGTSTDVSPIIFGGATPLSTTPLTGRLENSTGQLTVHFQTDARTPTGAYRITMTTTDRDGNAVTLRSRPFVVSAAILQIQFEGYPPNGAVADGKLISFTFVAHYRGGKPLVDADGRPSVVTMYNGRPVAQRPDLEDLGNGRWKMTWTAPETIPDGSYTFTVGGTDNAGNPITQTSTPAYTVKTDVGGSFLKVVPGPSPALLLLGVGALAALLGAVRRRK